MPDPLASLKRAEASKRRADERFRAALLAAARDYEPATLAQVIGWTRQRVRQQLLRWERQEWARDHLLSHQPQGDECRADDEHQHE